MAADSLCVGDQLCLYSEEAYGFVYSLQTSSIYNELAIQPRQDRLKPDVPDPLVLSFEICVANRYKLSKKHRELKAKSESKPQDVNLRSQVSQAALGAEAEQEDNVVEQRRLSGKKVLYGQVIQLKHVFTNKFIHVSTTQTSRTESSNMQVELTEYDAKQAQFRIMPRYKVKAEGDIVQVGDQVVLESVKSPGQFLHISQRLFEHSSIYKHNHELNLSVRQSGFTVYRRYKPEKTHINMVRAGMPLRFFHKEIEAYMVAEGLFDDELTEDVHLRVRPMDQSRPKTLFPSTSAITYWQVEMQLGATDGGVLRWEQQIRFKHMTTRKYLMSDGKTLTLTSDHRDPKTVFRLHPVIKEKDQIEFETYCRIEHVMSATWLHAQSEEYVRKHAQAAGKNDTSMASLVWTTAPLRQIDVSGEMQYDDAFTLQQVEDGDWTIFNYMAGMVPFIQNLLKEKKDGQMLKAKQTFDTVKALGEIKAFMMVNSEPHKGRQKLLRNFRIVELLVKIMQLPLRGAPDQHHLTTVIVECYDVLYTYLMGDSRKNELYIAKHIDFFETQVSFEGPIGLNAAHMVMELVKDNRKIVDRITHQHMDHFVELLRMKKNYRYLDLLSVLCVCDGVSIQDNQTYITDIWLKAAQKNCVYNTELGQAIGKETNIVYVSKDNQRTWVALHEFVRQNSEANLGPMSRPHTSSDPGFQNFDKVEREKEEVTYANYGKDLHEDEEFLFLDHQLDLFTKLCYGRNEYAIKVITKDLGYLTWEEAFSCLTNENLPDQLRAKYCHLIISLFVDVGENSSVLDRMNLTFVYDNVSGKGKRHDEAEESARNQSTTKQYFPQLRDWVSNFLAQNTDMTASEIGHNMLLEQVLRLVHYLAKFGFYGQMEDIQQLLGPLLSLLDGRNDKPYPKCEGVPEMQEVLARYRSDLRFKQSPEAKAVVDAKAQAMEVLDLFLNYRFNIRLERFVAEFKLTHNLAHHVANSNPPLGKLLYEDYDLDTDSESKHCAMHRLKEIFNESAFFKTFPIKEVLLDLSHYDYDQMVVKSMTLLNRYFSSHDNLFKRAVQAQLLITDRSAEVLVELREILPTMQRLTSAKMSQEQSKTMGDILDKMIRCCALENEPEEHHPMNQNILYNHSILATVFDILSQEIDIRLMTVVQPEQTEQEEKEQEEKEQEEKPKSFRSLFNKTKKTNFFSKFAEQYRGTQQIFQKSFTLLKVMAHGNEVVQQRLFDRMDMLLSIQGAEPQMAEALTEVFTGNKNTCLKILSHQVQHIMMCVAQHTTKAPQFLDLLNAIVKVEELNLPLKRNQGYVMKYFMQYRSEVAHVIDQPSDSRKQLMTGKPCPDLDYLISLVDLLATCAEGENRFIESICQTIFNVAELMDILNDPNVDNNLKRPYLRFLLWVYLNTAGGMIDSGAGDLPHDKSMWSFINSLNEELSQLTKYTAGSTETVKQMLKKAPGKSGSILDQIINDPDTLNTILSERGKGDWKTHHGSLHYMIDAVFPFLQVFFRTYYQPDRESFPDEADYVDKLSNTLMEFTKVVGPLISNNTHMKNMVSCMNVLLSASTLPVTVMEEFQEKYGSATSSQDVRSDARRAYDEHYQQEEELNAQLNIFAVNYSMVYGGFNDVKTQIGFHSGADYTEVGGDEELPLGHEFQEHIQCFIERKHQSAGQKYAIAGKLVEQLQISGSHSHMNEKQRLNQEELDIKCLQLLRGMIHNEIVRLPEDWEDSLSSSASKRQLKQIDDVQTALNSYGAMLKVLPHLSKPSDDIVREVLGFLAAMLFGGNEKVQQSLIDYFLGTREEFFFFSVKNRMQLSAIATKEKRSLIAQHQAKVEEAMEQAKALRKAMKTGKMAAQQIMAANQSGSTLLGRIQSSRSSIRSNMGGRKKRPSGDALKARYGGTPGHSRRGSLSSMPGSRYGSTMNLAAGPASGGEGPGPGSHYNNNLLGVPGGKGKMDLGLMRLEDKLTSIGSNKVAPMSEENPEIKIEELDEQELEELAANVMEDDDFLDYRDDGYIALVLKILGLMCDGQNAVLQDYLREQPDNIKSVNLVAETARFLSLLYSSINAKTIDLVTELFQTLVEFTSGNIQNQSMVFENKTCEYINFILRGAQFQNCRPHEIIALKSVIGTLITSLTEENPRKINDAAGNQKTVGIAKEVAETLDAESIWNVAFDCYQKANRHEVLMRMAKASLFSDTTKDALQRATSEMKETLRTMGFSYYHILMRLMDLDEEGLIKKNKFLKTPEDMVCWDYYVSGTLSIEVLKDDELQKLYFRCKDKNELREDVKELFKYEVDRSSPSNKIREFMDWSKDIMADIKYTRKVLANAISRFFVKYWWHFNIAMIFISFLFFFLIMITWREPVDAAGVSQPQDPQPVFAYDSFAIGILTYVLGGMHNLLAFCVLVSYFITNHPSLPKCKSLRKCCRTAKKKMHADDPDHHDDDDEEDEERVSNLEVKFFSFKTIWYLMVFACSILGTVFYGYFFSFHLLHMANFNQLLKRAIQAVTKNGLSLLWVFLFGMCFIFIYALIAFAFFRELYDGDASGLYCSTMYECFTTNLHRGLIVSLYEMKQQATNRYSLVLVFMYGLAILYIYALIAFAYYREIFNADIGKFCSSFYQCMVTTVHHGLLYGMFDFLVVPEGKSFSYHLIKAIYDITFFIIITTIGLNIIFGIIVDTFSELRDNKWQVDNDMRSNCFICSRNSYDFEHQGGGFEKHVKQEHNQWAYLFFFIHLDETRPNNYTALELYISRQLEVENYDFFPLDRALGLQQEADSGEVKLEMLMSQVEYLVTKMKQEESERVKEREKRRQREWEQKHRK